MVTTVRFVLAAPFAMSTVARLLCFLQANANIERISGVHLRLGEALGLVVPLIIILWYPAWANEDAPCIAKEKENE